MKMEHLVLFNVAIQCVPHYVGDVSESEKWWLLLFELEAIKMKQTFFQ